MAEIATLGFPGFTGGLNKESDPVQVTPEELREALNVVIGLSGSIARRPGWADINDASVTIADMFYWRDSDGDPWYAAIDESGNLLRINTGNPASAFASQASEWGAHTSANNYPVGFAALAGKQFFTSRRGTKVWINDGTSFSSIDDTNLSGGGNEFPAASFLVSAHSRMFAFRCFANGVGYSNRMFYSAPGDPLNWKPEDFIDFNPDDGDAITAAVAYGEAIVVFKRRSMHLLSGVDEDTFTVFPLDQRIGTTSHRTVVVDGATLYWFDARTGVWSFDGQQFNKLDDKINKYLLDGINHSQAYKAKAFMWDHKYCLSVPWGEQTRNSRTFVFDTRLQNWVEWDFGVQGVWDDEGQNLYIGSPLKTGGSTNSKVAKFGDGVYSDGGSNYTSTARTGWISPTNGGRKHRLRRLDASFSALGQFDLTFRMYRNYGLDVYKQKTVQTSPGGTVWGTTNWGDEVWGRGLDQLFARLTGWGERWRWVSFEFEMVGQNNQFELNRLQAHVSVMGSLREGGSQAG